MIAAPSRFLLLVLLFKLRTESHGVKQVSAKKMRGKLDQCSCKKASLINAAANKGSLINAAANKASLINAAANKASLINAAAKKQA